MCEAVLYVTLGNVELHSKYMELWRHVEKYDSSPGNESLYKLINDDKKVSSCALPSCVSGTARRRNSRKNLAPFRK